MTALLEPKVNGVWAQLMSRSRTKQVLPVGKACVAQYSVPVCYRAALFSRARVVSGLQSVSASTQGVVLHFGTNGAVSIGLSEQTMCFCFRCVAPQRYHSESRVAKWHWPHTCDGHPRS